MATRLLLRVRSHLHRTTTTTLHPPLLHNSSPLSTLRSPCPPQIISPLYPLRFLSSRRGPTRPKHVDIGARARQLQTRRLWTYALTFSCVAGFIVMALYQFQEQMVFYVTPSEAMEKFLQNPAKNKFRLGGLVLEGSVSHPAHSPELEFVVTDLITDILVRFNGSLPDLFREGHSVVVEGFVKPYTDEVRKEISTKGASAKARSGDYYFSAVEVLAKHDEKYMPQEVAAAIERNRKKIEGGQDIVAGAKVS